MLPIPSTLRFYDAAERQLSHIKNKWGVEAYLATIKKLEEMVAENPTIRFIGPHRVLEAWTIICDAYK